MKGTAKKVGNKKVTDPSLKSDISKPREDWADKQSTGREEDLKEGDTIKSEENWTNAGKKRR